MLRLAITRLVVLLGVVAIAAAVDPHQDSLPTAVVLCLLGAILVGVVDRRAVLEAGVAASLALAAAFRAILVPGEPAPVAALGAARRRGLAERGRRGTFRRLERPDVAGKPRARAPGRA